MSFTTLYGDHDNQSTLKTTFRNHCLKTTGVLLYGCNSVCIPGKSDHLKIFFNSKK